MIHEVQSFGARLKAERERRGISLDSIAEQTKIQKAFLDSLERGDFSKWPAGEVFRRAYIRDYAAAIGLARVGRWASSPARADEHRRHRGRAARHHVRRARTGAIAFRARPRRGPVDIGSVAAMASSQRRDGVSV